MFRFASSCFKTARDTILRSATSKMSIKYTKSCFKTLVVRTKKTDYSQHVKYLCYLTCLSAAFSTADNCGIVGVVGTDNASDYLLEGLVVLRNRGYDSAGMATIDKNGKMTITKYASKNTTADSIDLVKNDSKKHDGSVIGIAHTRWATHGGRTDANAHPHTDYKKRIAVVHNGTINNSYDLKKELMKKGIQFTSETDTEVIAQLIGLNLDTGMDTKDAVYHALQRYVHDTL